MQTRKVSVFVKIVSVWKLPKSLKSLYGWNALSILASP